MLIQMLCVCPNFVNPMVTDSMKRNSRKVLNAASRLAMGTVSKAELVRDGWDKSDVEWLASKSGMLREEFIDGAISEMENLMSEAFEQLHGRWSEMKAGEIPKAMDVLMKHWKEFSAKRSRDRQMRGDVIDVTSLEISPDQVVTALTGGDTNAKEDSKEVEQQGQTEATE